MRPTAVLAFSMLLGAALSCREDAETPSSPSIEALGAVTTGAVAYRQVTGGWSHTCGVATDNRAYCWGVPTFGALGDGTGDGTVNLPPRLTPVAVLGGLHFRQLSAGGTHTCGVTTANQAYCWGANRFGQLGDGSPSTLSVPTPVTGDISFVQLDAGVSHTCGLSYPDRRAYCWGSNFSGQLGDGTMSNRNAPVAVLGGRQFRQVSAGERHTCGVTTDNRAYCWGDNSNGQLGDSSTSRRLVPVPVAGERQFRQVDAGWTFTCAVTTGHQAFCWGQGRYGQLGNGKTGRRLVPKPVTGGLRFERVTTGWRHACGESVLNRAYCWGYNYSGSLGGGTPSGPESCNTLSCSKTPAPVVGGLLFQQLSAGQVHVCGKTAAGVAYCWGGNSGTLGNGDLENRTTPTPVADPS